MLINVKRSIKAKTLVSIISLTFFSCRMQEKSLEMYNIEDKEIYYSTVKSLYKQQKLTEDAKDIILTSDPKVSYTLHIINKAIQTEYPGYSGDFRFMQQECFEQLVHLTISLENGENISLSEHVNIHNNENIPIDEGFIKQIISVYGLLFIHKPEDCALIIPSFLTFLHLLNLKVINLNQGKDLLKIENLRLLLSIEKFLENPLEGGVHTLFSYPYTNYNQFIGDITVAVNYISDPEKLEVQQTIDLINVYRLQHNLHPIL